MEHQKILVLDFGGQYNQLIARRVRDLGVYAEVKPFTTPLEAIRAEGYIGIIFTGGPNSVYEEKSPKYSPEIFALGVPVLGICYGAQLMAHLLGGEVKAAPVREYGKTEIAADKASALFNNTSGNTVVWMSHTDYIARLPEGFISSAHSDACPVAAMENREKNLYAVQFHLEVQHTAEGDKMLRAFLYDVCKAAGDWTMDSFVEETVAALRTKIGDKKVLCALSGGVDSSVAAVMIHKAVGKQLTCIFVDNGLLRKNEGDEVEKVFREQFDINMIRVNAQDRFLSRLAGAVEPEKKRKAIGEEFIRVFEAEAKKLGRVDYLVQGTIYPDVIESGAGDAANIKSHHNVGGLPEHVGGEESVEPLRYLF